MAHGTGQLVRQVQQKTELARLWLSSRRAGRLEHDRFDQIEAYCMFVGYPRSGASLLGSLLDAHPEMIVAHELHALRYAKYGFGRDQLFHLLCENSRRKAGEGRIQTGYRYDVPGQWQGRARRLRVVGDKRAGTTIRKIHASPRRLEQLRRVVRVPIRFVHAVRNPFDNVSTIFRRSSRSLEQSVEHYFRMVEGIQELWSQVPDSERIDVHHDDVVRSAATELKRLCRFFGLEAPDDYLRDCASIVWSSPRRTRHEIEWPPDAVEALQARIERVPFLARYRFED